MILNDSALRSDLSTLFPEHWKDLLSENRIQPASVDLTVKGPLMRVDPPGYSDAPLRPGKTELREVHLSSSGGWVLRPGVLYLVSTRERVLVPPDMVGRLDGRSSWGRIGLRVHATAGFLDPGFSGLITLELDVVGPSVELRPGDSICQVSFSTLSAPAEVSYRGKYHGQTEVTASREMGSGDSR